MKKTEKKYLVSVELFLRTIKIGINKMIIFFFVIVKMFGKDGQKEKLEINKITLEDFKIN